MKAIPLSLLLALRFNQSKRRSGMVSFISLVSTIGITLGTAVLIVGLSAMNGFEYELQQRVLAVVPQGEVIAVQQPYQHWQMAQRQLVHAAGIKQVSPFITFTGLLENGIKSKAVQLRGIDPQNEQKISALPDYVQGTPWSNFQAGHQQIIIGKGVAQQLGIALGDWITVLIPEINPNNLNKISQPKRVRLQVVGMLNLAGDLGYSFALIPLHDAQKYLDYGEAVTGLMLTIEDIYHANDLVLNAANRLNHQVYAMSWMVKYGRMYNDIQLVRVIMYLSMFLVIGVACFNIVSTAVMAIKDKRSDIAILRTLGANDRLIRMIFIWYGLIKGAIGSLTGIIIGILCSLQLTQIIRIIEKILGRNLLSGDIYFIDFLPSVLRIEDVIIVLLTSLFLSLLASGYPALRASRINPAQILNGQ